MSYYGQGDYYQGDYYQGDPGIFGALGHFAKGLVTKVLPKAILGGVTGGLPGVVIGTAGGFGALTAGRAHEALLRAGGGGTALTPALVAGHKAALARGPGLMPGVGIMAPGGGMPGVVPFGVRRMHPNRSTYVTRGGGTSRWPLGLQEHPKGTELVPSRRMNVGNARALRRALRRARGFAKLAHRVLRATRQFKGKGFGGVRRVRGRR